MAQIYKRISNVDALNRNQTELSENDKVQTNSIIGKFIDLFKEKHLS